MASLAINKSSWEITCFGLFLEWNKNSCRIRKLLLLCPFFLWSSLLFFSNYSSNMYQYLLYFQVQSVSFLCFRQSSYYQWQNRNHIETDTQRPRGIVFGSFQHRHCDNRRSFRWFATEQSGVEEALQTSPQHLENINVFFSFFNRTVYTLI